MLMKNKIAVLVVIKDIKYDLANRLRKTGIAASIYKQKATNIDNENNKTI
jgi:hypothetical protein